MSSSLAIRQKIFEDTMEQRVKWFRGGSTRYTFWLDIPKVSQVLCETLYPLDPDWQLIGRRQVKIEKHIYKTDYSAYPIENIDQLIAANVHSFYLWCPNSAPYINEYLNCEEMNSNYTSALSLTGTISFYYYYYEHLNEKAFSITVNKSIGLLGQAPSVFFDEEYKLFNKIKRNLIKSGSVTAHL